MIACICWDWTSARAVRLIFHSVSSSVRVNSSPHKTRAAVRAKRATDLITRAMPERLALPAMPMADHVFTTQAHGLERRRRRRAPRNLKFVFALRQLDRLNSCWHTPAAPLARPSAHRRARLHSDPAINTSGMSLLSVVEVSLVRRSFGDHT